jgi:hypothetical protein
MEADGIADFGVRIGSQEHQNNRKQKNKNQIIRAAEHPGIRKNQSRVQRPEFRDQSVQGSTFTVKYPEIV